LYNHNIDTVIPNDTVVARGLFRDTVINYIYAVLFLDGDKLHCIHAGSWNISWSVLLMIICQHLLVYYSNHH